MPKITLTKEEEAELARLCHDPEHFHSDGREVMWACTVIPLLCLPLLAVLWGDASKEWSQLKTGELTIGTSLLFMAPELLGFVLLQAAAIAIAAYGLQTRGRHGVVITSFGVARLRGRVRTLIRYTEMASATFTERRLPRHHVVTDELEVKAKDGRVIMLYGFQVASRKQRIEARLRQANPAP